MFWKAKIWLCLGAPSIAFMIAVSGSSAFAQKPVMLGPILLGYDLDLPENPTPEQQIKAGEKQIELFKHGDQTLDSDRDAVEYFNGIIVRLLKTQESLPPVPIFVHVSTEPITNAEALPGGQILVFSHIFDLVDDEAELVGILAHETAHQLHGDFLKFWHDYKQDKPVYGGGGVLEESQGFEAAADDSAVRMMYDAGWNPSKFVLSLQRLQKLGVRERHGAPTFYSTHPRDPERITALEKLIASFPPKPGLIDDSTEFRALKQRL